MDITTVGRARLRVHQKQESKKKTSCQKQIHGPRKIWTREEKKKLVYMHPENGQLMELYTYMRWNDMVIADAFDEQVSITYFELCAW